jgi:adenine deaminase
MSIVEQMKDPIKKVSGNIVDVTNSAIYPGTLEIRSGKIVNIVKEKNSYKTFILPGLIDSHYMIENGNTVPFKFYFGAPSCVPATPFETSGAYIGVQQIDDLLKNSEIKYLSEMMNFPGVLNDDPDVMVKIGLAKKYGKPIDGHAPSLRDKDLEKYIAAGISTDHETMEKEEALEKLKLGMKIIIREGSAAKNFDALIDLVENHYDRCMFCSDDKHPDDLVLGHINELVKRALKLGIDKMKVLKCACVNPVLHYALEVGLLQKGDSADFIEIDNFEHFNILRTYISGELVAENGKTLLPKSKANIINYFKAKEKQASDFYIKKAGGRIEVIEAIDGQLITNRLQVVPKISNGMVISNRERDILKIVVLNRYQDSPPAIGFVKNFGLQKGAIASSVSHDSHNIIAIGVTDDAICQAVNLIVDHHGGMAVVYDDVKEILPLPVAGIMTNQDGFKVARLYSDLDKFVKKLGSNLEAPFMTLSFMALPVIPKIKLTDKGLVDGEMFELINLFL